MVEAFLPNVEQQKRMQERFPDRFDSIMQLYWLISTTAAVVHTASTSSISQTRLQLKATSCSLIFLLGPSGSGKTLIAHAALSLLHDPSIGLLVSAFDFPMNELPEYLSSTTQNQTHTLILDDADIVPANTLQAITEHLLSSTSSLMNLILVFSKSVPLGWSIPTEAITISLASYTTKQVEKIVMARSQLEEFSLVGKYKSSVLVTQEQQLYDTVSRLSVFDHTLGSVRCGIATHLKTRQLLHLNPITLTQNIPDRVIQKALFNGFIRTGTEVTSTPTSSTSSSSTTLTTSTAATYTIAENTKRFLVSFFVATHMPTTFDAMVLEWQVAKLIYLRECVQSEREKKAFSRSRDLQIVLLQGRSVSLNLILAVCDYLFNQRTSIESSNSTTHSTSDTFPNISVTLLSQISELVDAKLIQWKQKKTGCTKKSLTCNIDYATIRDISDTLTPSFNIAMLIK